MLYPGMAHESIGDCKRLLVQGGGGLVEENKMYHRETNQRCFNRQVREDKGLK